MLSLLLLLQDGLVDQAWFRERGLGWTLTGTAEVFSNVRGGLDTGTEGELLLDAVIDADLETLLGWTGAKARINPMWIEGHGLSREHVGDFTKVSNIDARDAVRVFEVWLQQGVGGLSLRAGILAADQEFALAEAGTLFVNGTFGPPVVLTLNAPFSAYPLGSLGARLRVEPAEGFYAQAALYEGSPDSEAQNRSGLEVRLHHDEGLLWVGEAGWSGEGAAVKMGGFVHSGEFLDHSSGLLRRGHHGVYGVVEGSIAPGLTLFVRVGAGPERNALLSRYGEAGVVWTGAIPGRPDDQLGIACVHARLSDEIPGARYEAVVEATYKAVLTPWLALQPDVQFIRHPGGFGDVDDATVVGIRIDVLF